MKQIISSVLSAIGSKLGTIILQLLSCISKIVDFLTAIHQKKTEEKKKKDKENLNSKIDDVCNNGTIEDLLDL